MLTCERPPITTYFNVLAGEGVRVKPIGVSYERTQNVPIYV